MAHPTLLDGAETAPPEDVGGIDGFYEFMEVYKDEKHPAHDEMKAWVQEQPFREYDPVLRTTSDYGKTMGSRLIASKTSSQLNQ